MRPLAALLVAFACAVAAPAAAHAADNAAFIAQSVPTAMIPGQTSTVSVTMQNTGTTTWMASSDLGYKLGTQSPQDNTLWAGTTRIYLSPGEAVIPGQSRSFTFPITAPATPGTYSFQWRMVHEGVAWFGAASTLVTIRVTAPPPYGAQLVSQAVPTTLTAGQTVAVAVTMKNTGTNLWTAAAGYKLGAQNPQDNTTWGTGRVNLAAGDALGGNADKTFTFDITAPATAGTYNFQWRMLQEGVTWFGDLTPNVAIRVTAPPVTLCPGVAVTPDGTSDLGPAIQSCIDHLPAGGTLSLPPGLYGIATQVVISKPLTLQTQGLSGSPASCEAAGAGCAVLQALPSFSSGGGGLVAVEATREVTLDHLVLDGNRAARLGSTAAAQCAAGNNRYGFNARMSDCASCRFTSSVSRNALCGSGLEFRGHDAVITGNVFRANGQNAVNNMWSDGLTVHYSDRATIADNLFVDNSDVALILGGGRGAVVRNNSISQPGQVVFAGLMLDNFNGGTPGDFTGAVVSGNTIDCTAARNCHFGIELGPHPWYLSTSILAGDVHGNTVTAARQGINVEGAGTAAAPLLLYGNTVGGSAPGSARFNCGAHSTSDFNINTADSVVNRNGETSPTTSFAWHSCP
jgi:hypothetical protein